MEYFPLEEKVRGITTFKDEERYDFLFKPVKVIKKKGLSVENLPLEIGVQGIISKKKRTRFVHGVKDNRGSCMEHFPLKERVRGITTNKNQE